jgi:hypothetical protein
MGEAFLFNRSRREGHMPHEYYSRGSVQSKHTTRATKLDLLKFVARYQEVDVVTVAQYFRLSEAGAKVKLWRLSKQSLLQINPESYKPKTWQLTRAGRRDLAYLTEAEDYGGPRGLLIRNLQAEVACIKGERDHWKKIVEDAPGVFRDLVAVANENVALRRDLAAVTREMQRLRHDYEAMRAAITHRYRR